MLSSLSTRPALSLATVLLSSTVVSGSLVSTAAAASFAPQSKAAPQVRAAQAKKTSALKLEAFRQKVGQKTATLASPTSPVATTPSGGSSGGDAFVGGVYAMTNEVTGNAIVAYGRRDDGTLSLLGTYPTGSNGAAFDGGEGLDPLISAYALFITPDNEHILAVNAGSGTISIFRVNDDRTLTLCDLAVTGGVGPNSIAVSGDTVYVANIDADGVFAGEPDQEGSLRGFRISPDSKLIPIPGSTRYLGNRPSAIQFSPSGDHLVVTSINAGSAALASGSVDEVVVYGLLDSGQLTPNKIGAGSSTLPFNFSNRNLPSAIGFEIVEDDGREYVVVTEAREFQADGTPPAFPNLQTGSVSTWELLDSGALVPRNLDILTGDDFFDGERTACWIEFNSDESVFFVSNALEATLSSFYFDGGQIGLIQRVAAAGTPPSDTDPFGTSDGFIDLWASQDGRFVYQLFGLAGTIGVYRVAGSTLIHVEDVAGDLPLANTQGIVAF